MQHSSFPEPPKTHLQDQDDTRSCSRETAREHQPGHQGCSGPCLTDESAHRSSLHYGTQQCPPDSMPASIHNQGKSGFQNSSAGNQLLSHEPQDAHSHRQKASVDAGQQGVDNQRTAHVVEAHSACSPSSTQQHACAASADHSELPGQPHGADAAAMSRTSERDVAQGSQDRVQTSSAAVGTPGWTVEAEQEAGEGQRGFSAVATLRREVLDLQMQVCHAYLRLHSD